jgi:hypothetical protein
LLAERKIKAICKQMRLKSMEYRMRKNNKYEIRTPLQCFPADGALVDRNSHQLWSGKPQNLSFWDYATNAKTRLALTPVIPCALRCGFLSCLIGQKRQMLTDFLARLHNKFGGMHMFKTSASGPMHVTLLRMLTGVEESSNHCSHLP